MKTLFPLFALFALALTVSCTSGENASAQQIGVVRPSPAPGRPGPATTSRLKLQQDTQPRIFSTGQDVQPNRRGTTDKGFNPNSNFIQGDRFVAPPARGPVPNQKKVPGTR